MKNTLLSSLLAAGMLFGAAGIAEGQNTAPQQSDGTYASLQDDYDKPNRV